MYEFWLHFISTSGHIDSDGRDVGAVYTIVRVSARDSNPMAASCWRHTNPLNYDSLFKNIFPSVVNVIKVNKFNKVCIR